MFKRMGLLTSFCLLAWVGHLSAEDIYFHASLSDLTLTEGSLPASTELDWNQWWRMRDKPAYAVLDGEGEVYVRYALGARGGSGARGPDLRSEIAIRVSQPRDVTGRLFLPRWNDQGMQVAKFRIPADQGRRELRDEFYRLKLAHYENLLSKGVPGAAWFRHEVRLCRQALGQQGKGNRPETSPPGRRPGTTDLADTFAMFTGGRAMSENLQLDRVLQTAGGGEETVSLDSIEGITVRPIDWKPYVTELPVDLDPLASKIPSDQHAIFFPSFNAAVAMADEMAADGTPILQLAESRSVSARTFQRYQQQMCLTMSDIARLLGPTVARSVAVTGSDPYFRTGTDVAVLFEAVDGTVLENLLMAQVSTSAAKNKDARPIAGEVGGLAYRGVRSADRAICCYIAKSDHVVIVTNSPYQLEQFVQVTSGKIPAIASLDEYFFFRSRYRVGEANETAFLFLSDATIRRWCGPRWRIATSRRTRDAAVVAEIQASQLDRLVKGNVQTGPIYTDLPVAGDGQLTLTSDGVYCSTTGSLAFMTPIAEMKFDRVTPAEAEAYRQWRDRYQSNWRWAFDPIGLQLGIHKDKLWGDLTITPLIWGSDYRSIISYSQGAAFRPDAGDLHNALAHAILSINTKSAALQQHTNIIRMVTGNAQVDPISWLGDYVSIFVDDDPFWDELAQVPADKVDDFMEKEGWRIPLAVRADVSSGLKLTAFLAALRGFVEQAAPGMLNWESLTYKDQPYVKITPTERAIGRTEQIRNLAVYYSASGDALIVTPNEDVLKHAIEREVARNEAKKEGQENPAPEHDWIGSNLGLQVEQKLLQVAASVARNPYETEMQRRAWGNLAILNEWKRRYPDQDPVALHERFWQEQLLCPGGGKYVWNDTWQTMESTEYGCPAAPKEGPATPPLLNALKRGNFGVTFEDQGLRARVSLDR